MKNVADKIWFNLTASVKQILLNKNISHTIYYTVFDRTEFPFVDRYLIHYRIVEIKGNR